MDAFSTARAMASMIPTRPVLTSPRVLLKPRWLRTPLVEDEHGHQLTVVYQPKHHPEMHGTRFTLYHNDLTIATGIDMYWDPAGILGSDFYDFEIQWKNLPQFTTSRSQRRLRQALMKQLTCRRY